MHPAWVHTININVYIVNGSKPGTVCASVPLLSSQVCPSVGLISWYIVMKPLGRPGSDHVTLILVDDKAVRSGGLTSSGAAWSVATTTWKIKTNYHFNCTKIYGFINKNITYIFQWNIKWNSKVCIQENAFEILCKMSSHYVQEIILQTINKFVFKILQKYVLLICWK